MLFYRQNIVLYYIIFYEFLKYFRQGEKLKEEEKE